MGRKETSKKQARNKAKHILERTKKLFCDEDGEEYHQGRGKRNNNVPTENLILAVVATTKHARIDCVDLHVHVVATLQNAHPVEP